jgi:hypothetical protein
MIPPRRTSAYSNCRALASAERQYIYQRLSVAAKLHLSIAPAHTRSAISTLLLIDLDQPALDDEDG